jgi:hypothetical protein
MDHLKYRPYRRIATHTHTHTHTHRQTNEPALEDEEEAEVQKLQELCAAPIELLEQLCVCECVCVGDVWVGDDGGGGEEALGDFQGAAVDLRDDRALQELHHRILIDPLRGLGEQVLDHTVCVCVCVCMCVCMFI